MSSFGAKTANPRETEAFAELVARAATSPMVVGLRGPLGAGKTCFVRGFVRGLEEGCAHRVASPTYSICNTYPSSPPVCHVDLYRIDGIDDLESVGFWDLIGRGFLLIEWPERVSDVIGEIDLDIAFDRLDGSLRRLNCSAWTPRGEAALQLVMSSRST